MAKSVITRRVQAANRVVMLPRLPIRPALLRLREIGLTDDQQMRVINLLENLVAETFLTTAEWAQAFPGELETALEMNRQKAVTGHDAITG